MLQEFNPVKMLACVGFELSLQKIYSFPNDSRRIFCRVLIQLLACLDGEFVAKEGYGIGIVRVLENILLLLVPSYLPFLERRQEKLHTKIFLERVRKISAFLLVLLLGSTVEKKELRILPLQKYSPLWDKPRLRRPKTTCLFDDPKIVDEMRVHDSTLCNWDDPRDSPNCIHLD